MTQDNALHFAVGCLHFSIAPSSSLELTWESYSQHLKSNLERIPNITNVVCSLHDIAGSLGEDCAGGAPLTDRIGAFPPYNVISLSFELYIPYRLQREYLRHEDEEPLSTERLKITFQPSFHELPVVFVELLNPTDTPRSPDAVVVVREFLEKTLRGNDTLVMDCLGPSPFHASFRLTSGSVIASDQLGRFSVNITESRGYDFIDVLASEQDFDSLNNAWEDLRHILGGELSLYYALIQKQSVQLLRWQGVEQAARTVVRQLGVRGFRGYLDMFLGMRSKVALVVQRLAEFEINRLEDENFRKHYYASEYRSTEDPPIIQHAVDREIASAPTYPVAELSNLVNFVEGRRVKGMEILVNVFVGLIGGAIGSIITLLMSR